MIALFQPILADNAAVFAIKNATTEGKVTVCVLLLLSLFSWSIIISKFRQIQLAQSASKKFYAAYGSTRDPLRAGDTRVLVVPAAHFDPAGQRIRG